MPVAAFIKDPDAVSDFKMRWAPWLKGDTIASSSWEAEDGIVIDSDSHEDSMTTVWLSGGTDGVDYEVTNRIVTVGGRTDDRTIKIRVRER